MNTLRTLIHRVLHDSLLRNSLYLMLATASLAFFGFLFWLLNARLFTPEEVGLATTLISVMTLLALISLIGCNAALVRFLPSDPAPNTTINTAFALVSSAAVVLSILFLIFVRALSPQLMFLHDNLLFGAAFVLFTVFTALNTLTDSIFLSHRKTHFIFGINTLYSAIRLFFPFIFLSWGAVGILFAAGVAQGIGLLISLAFLIGKFSYIPGLGVDRATIARMWKYSASNYTASAFNLLPATILPLYVTHSIGPASAAYYYIAMMIGNLLYVIPFATTRALFAEGSNDERQFGTTVRTAARIIALTLTPAILIIVFGGNFLLSLFGASYAEGGTGILTLIALSGAVVSIVSIYNAYFQVTKNTSALIILNVGYAFATLGLTTYFIHYGLIGVGAAWFLGNAFTALLGLLLYRYGAYLFSIADALLYQAGTVLWCKYLYLRALARNGFAHQSILFYPDMPRYYYIYYPIAHQLGYRMTTDPHARAALAVSFKDITVRVPDATEQTLAARGMLVNGACRDISKEHVEDIFQEIFGYGMRVDPRAARGDIVKKSNANAAHDGKVVQAPLEPEEGFIYQKLINNRENDRVADIRTQICGDTIPFCMLRTRSAFDRFDNTETATVRETADLLSSEEVALVLAFCKKIGLNWGELDVLRDRDDGKIYIVDANNTTGGPRPGFHCTYGEYVVYLDRLTRAFASVFLGGAADGKQTTNKKQ